MSWEFESPSLHIAYCGNSSVGTACPYDGEQLAQAALQDKKRRGSQITLVVPNSIGYCYRHTIPVEELRSFIGAGLGAE